MDEDRQHLQLLSIFHYIVGGLIALIGCLPTIHVAVGIAAVTGAFSKGRNDFPPEIGWFFIAIGAFLIAFAWTIAALIIIAGRKLSAHSAYTYCLVIAAPECPLIPFGTVLGVFTIIVLMRPSVKQLFDVSKGSGAS